MTEFKLGIGDDDAPAFRCRTAARIDGACQTFKFGCRLIPHHFTHLRDRDVFIMSRLSLAGWRKNGRRQPIAFAQTLWQSFTGKRAAGRIFFPRRTRNVTTDHTLNREDSRALAQHGTARERRTMTGKGRHSSDDLVSIGGNQMMRDFAGKLRKPPCADLRQHRTFERDRLVHHHIEGADTVGRNEQQTFGIDLINVAHLAAPEPFQRQVAGCHRRQDI